MRLLVSSLLCLGVFVLAGCAAPSHKTASTAHAETGLVAQPAMPQHGTSPVMRETTATE